MCHCVKTLNQNIFHVCRLDIEMNEKKKQKQNKRNSTELILFVAYMYFFPVFSNETK